MLDTCEHLITPLYADRIHVSISKYLGLVNVSVVYELGRMILVRLPHLLSCLL